MQLSQESNHVVWIKNSIFVHSLDCRSLFLSLNKFDIHLKFIPRVKIHFKMIKEKCFLPSFRLIKRNMLCEVAEMRSVEHTSRPWLVFWPSRWRQWGEAVISGPGWHCFAQLHFKTENDAKQKNMKVQVCFTTIASPQCRLISLPFCSNQFYTYSLSPNLCPDFQHRTCDRSAVKSTQNIGSMQMAREDHFCNGLNPLILSDERLPVVMPEVQKRNE